MPTPMIRLTSDDHTPRKAVFVDPALIFAIEISPTAGRTIVRYAKDGRHYCVSVTEDSEKVEALRVSTVTAAETNTADPMPQVGDSKCWQGDDGKPYKVMVESLSEDGYMWIVHTRTRAVTREAWTLSDWWERKTAVVWASDSFLLGRLQSASPAPSDCGWRPPTRPCTPKVNPMVNDTKRWIDGARIREFRVNHVSQEDGAVVLVVQPIVGRRDDEPLALIWDLDEWDSEHRGVSWSRSRNTPPPTGANPRDPRTNPKPNDTKSWKGDARSACIRVVAVERNHNGAVMLDVASSVEGLEVFEERLTLFAWMLPMRDVVWTHSVASPDTVAPPHTAPLPKVIHDEIEVSLLSGAGAGHFDGILGPIRVLADRLRTTSVEAILDGDGVSVSETATNDGGETHHDPCRDPRVGDYKRWDDADASIEALVTAVGVDPIAGTELHVTVTRVSGSGGLNHETCEESWFLPLWTESTLAENVTWHCADDEDADDDDGILVMSPEEFIAGYKANCHTPDDGTAICVLADETEVVFNWTPPFPEGTVRVRWLSK